MAVVLVAVVTLLPLILTPQLVFYFDVTPKILVLLVGTSAALLIAWKGVRAHSRGLAYLGSLLGAQAVSVIIATIFSTDRSLSLGGGVWRRFGAVTQIALLLFTWLAAQYVAVDPERVRRILRVMALAGIPAASYGILQYFGWDPLIRPEAYHVGEGELIIVRPPGTMGYVSYFATYLLSVIFAGATLVLIERERLWRIAGITAACLGTAALLLTGTRAAMLGLAGGGLFLTVWLRPRIRLRWMGAAAAALAAIAVFYFSPAGQLLRSRARWFVEDAQGGARLLLWRDSIRMAAARGIEGWGPETFSIHFPRYASASLARAYPEFYQESPHNIFLDAFVAQGVLGLVVLLALTALGFYAVWRSPDRKLGAALGAGLISILISQQFTSFIAPTAVYFYLTIALLVGHAFPAMRFSEIHLAPRIAAAVLAVAMVFFSVQLFAADYTLSSVSRFIRAGQLASADAAYQKLERVAPPGFRPDLWYSRAIAGSSQSARTPADAIRYWQHGLQAAVRASRNAEERQNACYNLAVFYGRQNDFPHTEQSLRAAISWAPNWYKPHWILAQVLRAAGRLDEAAAEAALAVNLNAKNPEVVRTYEDIRAATKISKK